MIWYVIENNTIYETRFMIQVIGEYVIYKCMRMILASC